ncbi:hypothetical protein DUNSADRAFT_13770, partial [Dunaliella salina]
VLLGTAATAAVTQVASSTIVLTPLAATYSPPSTSNVDIAESRVEALTIPSAARKITDPGDGAPGLNEMHLPSASVPKIFPHIRSDDRAQALRHAATEASLLAGTAAILWGALKRSNPRSAGAFSYTLTQDWAVVTAAVCCVVFPLADPVISQ